MKRIQILALAVAVAFSVSQTPTVAGQVNVPEEIGTIEKTLALELTNFRKELYSRLPIDKEAFVKIMEDPQAVEKTRKLPHVESIREKALQVTTEIADLSQKMIDNKYKLIEKSVGYKVPAESPTAELIKNVAANADKVVETLRAHKEKVHALEKREKEMLEAMRINLEVAAMLVEVCQKSSEIFGIDYAYSEYMRLVTKVRLLTEV